MIAIASWRHYFIVDKGTIVNKDFASSKVIFLLNWLWFPCIQSNANVKSEAHAIILRPKYCKIIILRDFYLIGRKWHQIQIFSALRVFLTALRLVTKTIKKFTPNSCCNARNILQRLICEKYHNIDVLITILPTSIQKKMLTNFITCHTSFTALYCQ